MAEDLDTSDDVSPVEEHLSPEEHHHHNAEQSRLLQLPTELLYHVLSTLTDLDLVRISRTCRTLAQHASNDLLWGNILNSNIPFKIHDPGLFPSFRSLYAAYFPCWFIPRSKVWFADTEHTGNLILARYDNRRGVIEAYRVVAERRGHGFQHWEWNPEVMIQPFSPKVRLWLDDPVLFFKNTPSAEEPPHPPRFLNGETRMPMALEFQSIFNSFSLCARSPPSNRDVLMDHQWPPPNVPSEQRVYRDADTHWSEWDEPPRHLNEISESAFRIRRWARMGMPIFAAGSSETLTTFATLDQSLYTPTKEKPYQGIWVGDYSAHGSEFLLFLHRDPSDIPASQQMDTNSGSGESNFQGSLEAIKLTGDPNVPRGEISFISHDIGPDGFIRVADEELFPGARIVRSQGHVAGRGFRDGESWRSDLLYGVRNTGYTQYG